MSGKLHKRTYTVPGFTIGMDVIYIPADRPYRVVNMDDGKLTIANVFMELEVDPVSCFALKKRV